MSFSFCLLPVESRYFSQAEKERNAWKAEQIHKMTSLKIVLVFLFIKNGCHFVKLLSLRKITWLNLQQQKTRGKVEHHIKIHIMHTLKTSLSLDSQSESCFVLCPESASAPCTPQCRRRQCCGCRRCNRRRLCQWSLQPIDLSTLNMKYKQEDLRVSLILLAN